MTELQALTNTHIWFIWNTEFQWWSQFSTQDKDFLIDQILLYIVEATHLFVDENADGLSDIIIGSNGITQKMAQKYSNVNPQNIVV